MLLLPPFPHIKASLFINHTILFGALFVFFIIYTGISSVLVYHWTSYGMRSPGVIFAETIYLFVSIVLFVVAGMSVFYF